jgi:hypothetical protein
LKLEVAEKATKSTSAIITLAVIAFFVGMVLIMLSIAAGFWLGQLMHSYALGFLVISAVYTLITLVVYVFQKKLVTNPVLVMMLKTFFD